MIYLQLLISGIMLGGVYALLSIGLTLIMGVVRLVSFCHGDIITLGMYITFVAYTFYQIDPYMSIVIVVPISFIIGYLIFRFVLRPTLGKPHVVQIFATLGVSMIIQNMLLTIMSGNYRTIKTKYDALTAQIGDISVSVPRVIAFAFAMVFALLLFWFINKTVTGKAMRATAQDRIAASLMGISEKRIFTITFAVGSALAGLAGALMMPFFSVYPTFGGELINVGFVAVVLGGMGSLPGALIGGLLLGIIETLSGYFIATSMKQAVYFAVFILILVIKPTGLLGVKGSEVFGE